MEWEGVFGLVSPFLNRKSRCRLRAVSRGSRDSVPKPKPFKAVNTSSVAKVKMILNLGKTLGEVFVWDCERPGLKKVLVTYHKHLHFDYHTMVKRFPWFRHSSLAKLFFLAYKFREYDSKLIKSWECYDWWYTFKPKRAQQILDQPTAEDCISPKFLDVTYHDRPERHSVHESW